jgi:hypothetical protein
MITNKQTVKPQIQQAEYPTPTVVISMEAACIENAILLDYLTSKVALEESEIGSSDRNIPTENNCTHDELHFEMPGDGWNHKDEHEESDKCDPIPTSSR